MVQELTAFFSQTVFSNSVILSLSKDQFGFPSSALEAELILRQAQDDKLFLRQARAF
jgi:hypothetical protein